jgi:P27 family predicted phage terminase small subunit
MPGPKPKPTHLKVVLGNPGKRALNRREPKPSGNLYDAPEYLTEDQRKLWTYAIETAPVGLLKRLDQSVLVVWVVAADLHRQAVEQLRPTEDGRSKLLTKTPGGMWQQSPFVSMVNKQAQIMMKAAGEMGFTPASRSKVEIDQPDEDNGTGQYFG